MTHLRPHRHPSGGRRLHQLQREHEERSERWVDGRPAAHPQQADPEKSKQEDSELQGGVSVQKNHHGHPELLSGEQEGI